jgi:hypothetical protein
MIISTNKRRYLTFTLSLVCSVTIKGLRIDDLIYWTLWYSSYYTLQLAIKQNSQQSRIHCRRFVAASKREVPKMSPASATSILEQQLTTTEPQRLSD